MLWNQFREAAAKGLDPLVQALIRAKISPTMITLAGPFLCSILCLWFVRTRAVVPFCAAVLLLGGLDVLDGMVARASGKVTRFGGYLDAMCDRYYEIIVILAVAAVTGYWLLCFLAFSGGIMTSYAKARAALEVSVSNSEWPDLLERGERSLIFVGGLALGAAVSWRPLGHDLFWWTLLLLAVFTHATVIQRILRARKYIEQRG